MKVLDIGLVLQEVCPDQRKQVMIPVTDLDPVEKHGSEPLSQEASYKIWSTSAISTVTLVVVVSIEDMHA